MTFTWLGRGKTMLLCIGLFIRSAAPVMDYGSKEPNYPQELQDEEVQPPQEEPPPLFSAPWEAKVESCRVTSSPPQVGQ